MRVVHTVEQAVQEGSANATVASRGGVSVYKTITEHIEKTMTLDASATDVAVTFTAITAVKTLFIESDQDLEVKLWGAAGDSLKLEATFPLAFVAIEAITEILLTNLSMSAATVKMILGA